MVSGEEDLRAGRRERKGRHLTRQISRHLKEGVGDAPNVVLGAVATRHEVFEKANKCGDELRLEE